MVGGDEERALAGQMFQPKGFTAEEHAIQDVSEVVEETVDRFHFDLG